MKTINHIIQLLLTIILLAPSPAEALEIREELYKFEMESVQNPMVTTFVMNKSSQRGKTASATHRPLVIHFDMGSSDLTSGASDLLHSGIHFQGITADTPLVITGHSCELGSSRLNLMLSLQRAITVAHYLINRGYTVSALQAKGEVAPVTTNLSQFYLNRRVEITRQP